MANGGNAMGNAVAKTNCAMSQRPCSTTQPMTNKGSAMGNAVANANCAMPQRPHAMPQAMANSGGAMGNAVTNPPNSSTQFLGNARGYISKSISKSMDGAKNRIKPVDYLP